MENSLELTLEQTIELAEYYDVETEGRSMVAIEADIKKGIKAVKNGFVKIFQVIIGWCRAIKAKLTKKDTVSVRPAVYNCGQRVISKCKDLEKAGKKAVEAGKKDEKLEKLEKAVDDLVAEFRTTKAEAKEPGKVAKIPVITTKVVHEIEELEKAAAEALNSANGETENAEKAAGFRAIVKACTTRKVVLSAYIGAAE